MLVDRGTGVGSVGRGLGDSDQKERWWWSTVVFRVPTCCGARPPDDRVRVQTGTSRQTLNVNYETLTREGKVKVRSLG